MFEFFKEEFFDFELTRILGTAPFGGCEIAEFLDAVGEIKKDNPESWHRAWHVQGEKAEKIAEDASKSGDKISARRAYLRASNYFRASQYMMNDRPQSPDSRVLPISERSILNFQYALKLLDGPVKHLDIPYERHKLPGYLYLPPAAKRLPGKIPVIINTGGGDSTQEELFFLVPAIGPDLGYAVLTFEGPGQGIVLRRDELYQRPDWEVVTKPVIDHLFEYAHAHPELDLDLERVAIAGSSMGSYYAIRGASDPRIKACVAMDPFYDMWDLAMVRMPMLFVNAWLSGWISDGLLNVLGLLQTRLNWRSRWEFQYSTWIFNLKTPSQLLRKMREYTFRLENGGEFLDRVKCPMFISGAAHSIYFKPEVGTTKIYDKLTHLREDQKELWIPSVPGEGGLQAKVGAFGLSQQRTFKFLDKHFGIERPHLLVKG